MENIEELYVEFCEIGIIDRIHGIICYLFYEKCKITCLDEEIEGDRIELIDDKTYKLYFEDILVCKIEKIKNGRFGFKILPLDIPNSHEIICLDPNSDLFIKYRKNEDYSNFHFPKYSFVYELYN